MGSNIKPRARKRSRGVVIPFEETAVEWKEHRAKDTDAVAVYRNPRRSSNLKYDEATYPWEPNAPRRLAQLRFRLDSVFEWRLLERVG